VKMNTRKVIPVALVAFLLISSLAALLTGCGKPAMPEVNNANCTDENIMKIEDKAMRQEFAGLCFHR